VRLHGRGKGSLQTGKSFAEEKLLDTPGASACGMVIQAMEE
jgi:hypothetical protein